MTLTIGPTTPPPLSGLAPSRGTAPAKEVRDAAAGVLGNQADIQRYVGGLLQGGFAEPPKLPMAAPLGNDAVNSAIVTLGGLSLSGGLNMQEIARAVYDDARESRAAVRTDRQVARDAAMQADQAAADDVRSSAKFTMIASIVSSSLSMVGALASAGGAGFSLKALGGSSMPNPSEGIETEGIEMDDLSSAASNTRQTGLGEESLTEGETVRQSKVNTDPSDILDDTSAETSNRGKAGSRQAKSLDELSTEYKPTKAQARASDISKIIDDGGRVLDNLGKIVAAPLSSIAAGRDADKLEQQAESTKQQAKADDDSDFVRNYTDLASSVLDKLSSMQEAQSQANQAIIANTKA